MFFLLYTVALIRSSCAYNAGYSGVTSKCLYPPLGPLPNGCQVSNLAVSSSARGNLIISDWKCNQTVDSNDFDHIPVIKFLNMPTAFQRNQTYLVSIVDKTSNQLLWLVANVTVANKVLSPGNMPWHGSFKNSLVIKSYQPPSVTSHSNNHSIEFLVFELKFNKPTALSLMTHSTYDTQDNFSLRSWLQMQTASGQITFCGPVGGGVAIAYKRQMGGPLYSVPDHNPRYPNPAGYPAVPSQQYNPYYLEHPPSGSQPPSYYNPPPSSHPGYKYPGHKGNLKGRAYSATSNFGLLTVTFTIGLLHHGFRSFNF